MFDVYVEMRGEVVGPPLVQEIEAIANYHNAHDSATREYWEHKAKMAKKSLCDKGYVIHMKCDPCKESND